MFSCLQKGGNICIVFRSCGKWDQRKEKTVAFPWKSNTSSIVFQTKISEDTSANEMQMRVPLPSCDVNPIWYVAIILEKAVIFDNSHNYFKSFFLQFRGHHSSGTFISIKGF